MGTVDIMAKEYMSDKSRITLTLCLSSEPWDAPTSIHEMLSEMDERKLKFVQNYKLNPLTPAQIAEENFVKFRTGLGAVTLSISHENGRRGPAARRDGDESDWSLELFSLWLYEEGHEKGNFELPDRLVSGSVCGPFGVSSHRAAKPSRSPFGLLYCGRCRSVLRISEKQRGLV